MLALLIAFGLGLIRITFQTFAQMRMSTIPDYEVVSIRAGMLLVGLFCWAVSEVSLVAFLHFLPTVAMPYLHGVQVLMLIAMSGNMKGTAMP